MTKTKKSEKNSSSKKIKGELVHQLEGALVAWKETMGEKKFKRRIKKAAKLIGKNLKAPGARSLPSPKKKADKKKTAVA